jgi:hypothetical protein
MSVRKLFTIVILLEILGMTSVAIAQETSSASAQGTSSGSGSKTIGERLDDFGRTLFGGLFSDNKKNRENKENNENSQNNKQAPRPIPGKYVPYQDSSNTPDSQGGAIIK